MGLERVDQLTGPLVVGEFYLVPTVLTKWNMTIKAWPVIGPRHDDIEFFNFSIPHYHVDGRFLPLKYRHRGDSLTYPLGAHRDLKGELPAPIFKKRKCIKAEVEITFPRHSDTRVIYEMHKHFTGQQCAHGKGGWICPHRKASLGSVLPVDGVITCPLHLLRINAETGVVL